MAIVWGIAIWYDRVQTIPEIIAIFAAIKPVVVVLTIQAAWKLGRSAIKNMPTGIAGIGSIGLFGFLDLNILTVLLLAGFGVTAWQNWRDWSKGLWGLWLPQIELPVIAIFPVIASHPSSLDVFTIFLKIGATIYGGGYVLLAFLQPELVDKTHWLTSTQLLDAIAIGQVTPGPLFTTATFIGYLLAGHQGAIAATIEASEYATSSVGPAGVCGTGCRLRWRCSEIGRASKCGSRAGAVRTCSRENVCGRDVASRNVAMPPNTAEAAATVFKFRMMWILPDPARCLLQIRVSEWSSNSPSLHFETVGQIVGWLRRWLGWEPPCRDFAVAGYPASC